MTFKMRELLIIASTVVLGTMLTVFACSLVPNKNAWPVFPLFMYFFVPLPLFLCAPSEGGFMSSPQNDALTAASHWFTGVVAASAPAMSLMLWHTDTIGWQAMVLSLSTGLCFAAGLGFAMKKSKESDADFF